MQEDNSLQSAVQQADAASGDQPSSTTIGVDAAMYTGADADTQTSRQHAAVHMPPVHTPQLDRPRVVPIATTNGRRKSNRPPRHASTNQPRPATPLQVDSTLSLRPARLRRPPSLGANFQ